MYYFYDIKLSHNDNNKCINNNNNLYNYVYIYCFYSMVCLLTSDLFIGQFLVLFSYHASAQLLLTDL